MHNGMRILITIAPTDDIGVEMKRKSLVYEIGMEQAQDLTIGERPPEFDSLAWRDWARRMDRAERLSNFIAGDLAHKIIQALNPSDFTV